MTLSKKTSADFKITKGTALVGSLKPDKISARKVFDSAQGNTMAGASSKDNMVAKVPIKNNV